MTPNQELDWVLRAREGDQQAFAELVHAFQRPIYNLCYRMLGSSGEAEDATQEAFLRAYTKLETYDPNRKFSSWVLSIASHHCIDRLRKRRGDTVSMDELQSWRWLPDDGVEPEQQALHDEGRHTVRTVLQRLPPQYRLVIVLRYWQDLSYEEIAQVTDSTQSAIKSRLHRARQMMAKMIKEEPAMAHVLAGALPRRETQSALSESF